MELFKTPSIDFVGCQKYFIGLSLVLIAAGAASLISRGGPRFGIDFKGGTLVYVKFSEEPDLSRIRAALNDKGLKVAALQPFVDVSGDHELKIDLDLGEEEAMSSGRERIVETLQSIYGGEEGKLDLNSADADGLAELLRRDTSLTASSEEINEAARAVMAFRDESPQSGLIKDFSELTSVSGVNPDIMAALQRDSYLGSFAIRGVGVVGPKVGRDLQRQAMNATLAALAGMLIYIAFRFELVYGVAAVIAVFHDVFITVGFFSLFDREIELPVIAALLTLVGYSMNDSIVIFDRVRENLKRGRRRPLGEVFNTSVNQTLARTILTSGLTLVAVLCLFIFGGEVLRGFSFALVVGVIVGTYSSIFVAGPILLWWQGLAAARSGAKGRSR